MNEQQVKIDLTEEQQIIELGRLAGECLENEAFQMIMEQTGKGLQEDFNRLTPKDQQDFTVLSSKRELFNHILSQFTWLKSQGEELKKESRREAGLV